MIQSRTASSSGREVDQVACSGDRWLHPIKATRHSIARTCQMRMVLPAAACGRQGFCQLEVSMLSVCCCCFLLFGLGGCAPSKIKKNTKIKNNKSYVWKQIWPHTKTPGKALVHSRRKIKLGARHGLNTARTAPRPRPQCPDGLPLQKSVFFPQTARVRRGMIENRRKNRNYYNYTYTTH